MTGFFKKIKETAEKSLEKSAEMGTKGYDAAKESAKKGYEKAKENRNSERMNSESLQAEKIPKNENNDPDILTEKNEKQITSQSSEKALKLLKVRFAKGEISKEEYEKMKQLIE